MSSLGRLAIWGFVTDVGGQLLITVLNFALVPVILNLVTAELFGCWLTIISVLTYLGLADAGLGIALTRLLAGATHQQDHAAFNRLISTAFFSFCIAGVLFALVGLSIGVFVPRLFHISTNSQSEVMWTYRIAVVAGAIGMPLNTFGSVIAGHQRMAVNNILVTIVMISSSVLSILLLKSGAGLSSFAISYLFTLATLGVLSFGFARRCLPSMKISLASFNRADLRRLWSFGGYFQLGKLAGTVAQSDSVIIASTIGAAAVTPYSLTTRLPTMLSTVVASKIPNALIPAISHLIAVGDIAKVRRLFIHLTSLSLRLAVLGSLFVLLCNEKFVSLWVGHALFGGVALNAVLVYWVLQDTIYRGTTGVIYALGDLRGWSMACLVEAFMNILLSLILVQYMGLVGVALATSIAKTLTTAWYTIYSICRKLNLSVLDWMTHGLARPFAQSIPSLALTVAASTLLNLSWGWWWLGFTAAAAVLSNLMSFEGIRFIKMSGVPFRVRLGNLTTLGPE